MSNADLQVNLMIATEATADAVQTKTARYWEVDTLRGIAIVLMVYFHLTWDLVFFGVQDYVMTSGPWSWFARFIATMFITVAGISLVLSYNRAKDNLSLSEIRRKVILRGARIFGYGLIITIATYFFLDFRGDRGFVIFGILHAIGFSIMGAAFFLPRQLRWVSLAVGLIFVAIGFYVDSMASNSPWLIPLGVKQFGRFMVDYYPVFPWFGVMLIGLFIGHTLYPDGVSRVQMPDFSNFLPIRGLRFLGRHSLPIYLIHQPILMAILFALGIASI